MAGATFPTGFFWGKQMMKWVIGVFALGLAVAPVPAGAHALGEDAQKVVDRIEADNPDMQAMCAGGESPPRPAVREAVMVLMRAGETDTRPRSPGKGHRKLVHKWVGTHGRKACRGK